MNADPLLRAAAIGQFSVALACGTTTFVQRPTSIIDGSPRMRVVVTGSALRARRPCDVYAIRAGSLVLLCWGSGTSRRRRTMLRQCMGRTWVTVWDTVCHLSQYLAHFGLTIWRSLIELSGVVDRLPSCCRSSRACKAAERTLPEPRLRQRARPDCAT